MPLHQTNGPPCPSETQRQILNENREDFDCSIHTVDTDECFQRQLPTDEPYKPSGDSCSRMARYSLRADIVIFSQLPNDLTYVSIITEVPQTPCMSI